MQQRPSHICKLLVWSSVLLGVLSLAVHPSSPCPDIFAYEGSEPENNRWYGEISLRTDESLVGIRLDIELDRPSDLMVSWMGEITTSDNVKFTVLNLNQKLRPGPPVLSRIMVKFNRSTGSPKLRFIRLNGRKICPEDTGYVSEYEDSQTRPQRPQSTKRPDPEFAESYGETVDEYAVNGNENSNNRPNNYNNNNNNNNNRPNNYDNENLPNTDYLSSSLNNNNNNHKPQTTTDEPYTTRRPPKGGSTAVAATVTTTTVRSPYESNDNRPVDNRPIGPNTVSLQASSTDSNTDINGVINGLLQNNKNSNKTVIITVIDNNNNNQQGQQQQQNNQQGQQQQQNNQQGQQHQQNNQQGQQQQNNQQGQQQQNNQQGPQQNNNRPNNAGGGGQSKPLTAGNRPSEQKPANTNQKPNNNNNNNQGSNSHSSTVGNSQQLASNSVGSCGEVKLAVPLVTSGQSTHRGQWPWHVALYLIEGINLSYHCGGSLVSKNKVITAAHCVTNKQNDSVFNSSKLVIYLGKYHQLQYSDELGVQTKQVVRISVYPSYNSSNYLGDIAVLTLSSDAEFTNYVMPLCLWDEGSDDLSDIVGKEGTVVGWGFDENDTPTEELKMAKMPVVSHQTCLWSYPQFYSEFTSDKTFCAGFRNGTSVCNGDSGGGMVFSKNSRWYLRGIVSITVAKEGLRVCDTRHYVVFTDVSKYLDFIKKNLR